LCESGQQESEDNKHHQQLEQGEAAFTGPVPEHSQPLRKCVFCLEIRHGSEIQRCRSDAYSPPDLPRFVVQTAMEASRDRLMTVNFIQSSKRNRMDAIDKDDPAAAGLVTVSIR
jgi:hypothetical protein